MHRLHTQNNIILYIIVTYIYVARYAIELTEKINCFGTRIGLSPTDSLSFVLISGDITLAVRSSQMIQVNINTELP